MTDSLGFERYNDELRNPETSAERVQQIFDLIFNGFIYQVNVKKVNLEDYFYVVEGEVVQNSFVMSGWMPPRASRDSRPKFTLYFPKAKLTKDQIIKLLEAAL